VNFFVDENLSPLVAAGLRDAGYDATHVADVGMGSAGDTAILEYAAASSSRSSSGEVAGSTLRR
jgi:predicted nuclease of predicted toxin-antitoxin system